MKISTSNIILILALGLFLIAGCAQEKTNKTEESPATTAVATEAGGPLLVVDKTVHDYGTIERGGEPYCEFTITNTGDEPLIISNAKGSCGCTVPEWSKEPVMPGQSTPVKVKYDTQRVGPFSKKVTLTTNSKDEPSKVLTIKGKVNAPEGYDPKAEQAEKAIKKEALKAKEKAAEKL